MPMQAREIAIIKRMHKVIKMPIVKIAAAVGRHKKSIYKALKTRKVRAEVQSWMQRGQDRGRCHRDGAL